MYNIFFDHFFYNISLYLLRFHQTEETNFGDILSLLEPVPSFAYQTLPLEEYQLMQNNQPAPPPGSLDYPQNLESLEFPAGRRSPPRVR